MGSKPEARQDNGTRRTKAELAAGCGEVEGRGRWVTGSEG